MVTASGPVAGDESWCFITKRGRELCELPNRDSLIQVQFRSMA